MDTKETKLIESPITTTSTKGSTKEENQERQDKFWEYYIEGLANNTPSFKEAGMKAGFTEAYCTMISQQKWFKDKIKKINRLGMLSIAEKNLEDILKMPYTKKVRKNGVDVIEVDTDILRLVLDTTKTVVKSLGKDEGYSERSEVTGKGGEPVVFMPAELLEKHNLLDK